MREDKARSGNDDLSIAAFSLMDVTKHVNSMSMPAGAMTSRTTNDEDMPSSSDNQPAAKDTPQSLYKRLGRALDNVMQEHNSPVKRPRARPSIMDLLAQKIRAKKLRSQLKQLNEEDPDDDYERDNLLITEELSSINNELTEVTDARQHNANTDHSMEECTSDTR